MISRFRGDVVWIKWITAISVWNIVIQHAQGEWSWADVDSRREMACEKYPITMRCPGHDVIQIVEAMYGRQSTDKCSASASETENTNCQLQNAKTIVEEKCNNKTYCSFRVTGGTFPDPCPGTKKYLETKFKCVRYMFSCPGSLTGIGSETSVTIDVQPQAGTWTKDPFYNTNHVFFAPVGNRVSEYATWEDFENGTPLIQHILPYNMAHGNLIADDGDLYFLKDNSRRIIKYSILTGSQTGEISIPGPRGRSGGQGKDISLAVDEQGLWAIYTRGKGAITFSKLDKDQLAITKTWTINKQIAGVKFSFFICGVFYSVNSKTGKVDYSYNTNLKSNQENRGLDIEFDQLVPVHQHSRRRMRNKAFLGYDASSLRYNPRDQLLYLWESTKGNAVYFKLHFDGKDPSKVMPSPIPSTTTRMSTTMSTTRRKSTTTITTSVAPSESETTAYDQQTPIEFYPPEVYDQDYCRKITRNSLNWPVTRVGEVAKLRCLDGQGGFATWRCVRESSMLQPDWHVAGPDLSDCVTWVSNIASDYKSGQINRATAFDSLATELDVDDRLDSKSVHVTAEFVDKLFEDTTLPSQEDAKKIVESMASISSNILSDEDAMESLSTEDQIKVAETLMNSTEKAGFMYAETIALTPVDSRNPGPMVISEGDILLQVEVREKTYNGMMSSGVTSFPDERSCASSSHSCGSDSITIHDADILGQKGEGPAMVVFSLYTNVGEYLSPMKSEWEVDSNIISASFQEPNFKAILNRPATIILKHNKTSRHPRQCVFWDHSDGSSGNWSKAGCRLLKTNHTHTSCQCDHLTSFAVLVNHQGVSMEPYHESSLDIITKVGISISIVCLVLCVLTFSSFRNLYNDRNTVHNHLCISLLLAEIVFLFGIDKTENATACSVVAGLLHYFFLAAFMWMTLEGFQLYVMLVEVFEQSSRLKWYYLAGYGIPAIIVGISAAIDHDGYGTEDVCWLQVDSGFIWSFVGPILIIIIVNLGFLSMTVYKMYVHTLAFTDSGKINSIKASVRGASVLLCLLGITWAFGILWINEDMAVLAYLFCIFNAFQGMFIFIFHCLLQKKVRVEYNRCFSRFPCCRKLGADSYVANSSSFQKQYTRGRFGGSANGSVTQTSGQQSQLQRMWNETVAPRNSESTPITSETTQNRDPVRPTTETSSRNMKPKSQTDRTYLQEDEVFLPPEDDQRSGKPTNSPIGDFHYDRLQHHHHHPDDYLVFHGEAQPMGRFNTGQVPPKSNARHPAPMDSNHQNGTNYGKFGPKSMSHSKVQDMLLRHEEDEYLQERAMRHGDPERWDSNRVQSHAYRRSLDENYGGKRDSGISLQRPPSNSRMLENTPPGRQTRNPAYRKSGDNTLGDRRMEDFDQLVKVRPNFSERNSLDEDRKRIVYSNHRRSATLDPASAPRCPIHHNMGVPLMGLKNKGSQLPNGHRRQKSLSSDSDDPIVTDCSVSSAGSSYGRQPPVTSHRSVNSPYYEEPICHKRRLPDATQALGKHREHWHNHSNISDQNRDENDLEVELITSSDNSIEANPGTLGYPPYRPPSPPRSGDDSSASATGGSRAQITDVSSYQLQGMAITQHKDTYGKPSPVDRRLKKTHNHVIERHSDEIIDAQGRALSNM